MKIKKYILLKLRYIVILAGLAFIPMSAEAALIQKSPPSSGLVGWWTLDGADVSDKIYDRSGKGNHGYFNGGATTSAKTAGSVGQAFRFDGVDDYVSSQNSIASARAGTMSAWIRPSGDYTSTQFVMGGAAPTGFGPTVRFLIEARNTGLCGSGDWLTLITNDPSSSQIVCSGQIYNAANFPAGVWTLLTITHDGSNVRFYKDGVLVNTVAQTASGVGGAQPFSIGRAGAFDGSYFSGSIDDVRIYNRALSAAEVRQLYNSQQSVPKLNTSQQRRITSDLVGFWTLDDKDVFDNTTAYDRSGQGNNGTLTNGPVRAIGKFAQALTFDGVDSYVRSAVANFRGSDSQGTVSAWFKTSSSGNGVIFSSADEAGSTGYIGLGVSGGFVNIIKNSGFSFNNVSGVSTTINDNKWHHAVWTSNGTSWSIYVDGVAQTMSVINGANDGDWFSDLSGRDNVVIGNIIRSDGPTIRPFNGQIDEVRVYNRPLSAEEVRRLYEETGMAKANASKNASLTNSLVGLWSFDGKDMAGVTAYDRSGQGNNGTLTNGPLRAIGRLGQALKFNGTNSRVINSSPAGIQSSAAQSASLWFKINSLTVANRPLLVAYTQTSSPFLAQFILGFNVAGVPSASEGTGKLNFIDFNGTSISGAYTSNDFSSPLDKKWHHAVGMWDGSRWRIFIDGVEDTVSDQTQDAPTTGIGMVLLMGSDADSTNAFDGLIDDVRIYNRALSAAEIKRLYNMGR